jgi:Zn-dependent oligopeptidase
MQFENMDSPFDSQQVYYDVMGQITNTNCISTNSTPIHLPANFSHIMDSYDAGYYGYLLTDTYAANMFYKMFRDGHILDPIVGMHYRKTMLEPGSTKDGSELLLDFLGSKPDIKYFLVDRGFIDEQEQEKEDERETLPVSEDWKRAVSTGMSMRDFQSKYAAELARD